MPPLCRGTFMGRSIPQKSDDVNNFFTIYLLFNFLLTSPQIFERIQPTYRSVLKHRQNRIALTYKEKKMSLGVTEIVLIVFVVVLIFGANKIPEIARGFGKAEAEYKKAKREAENQIKEPKKAAPKKVSKTKTAAKATSKKAPAKKATPKKAPAKAKK